MTRLSCSPTFGVRLALRSCTIACLVSGSLVIAPAQTATASPAETQHPASLPRSVAAHSVQAPGLYDPVADPKAVVRIGNARFTVLTPQLIRMEWAADGQFENHASLVFLNRHLPVTKFVVSTTDGGSTHII